MGRRPRADGPGTWHHVIHRGIARRPGELLRRAGEFAALGLARDLCGHSLEELARSCGGSRARARWLIAGHRRFLISDLAYAERASLLAHAALELCHGRRPAPVSHPGG
ncbi:MAG: hypothetical protein QF410_04260 [Planctomycetota bacterium]|nr:hypothetical protein [Planctomycetota bacterium]MDP6761598.1 hypothetical protein [Planctomycetota bacterium]